MKVEEIIELGRSISVNYLSAFEYDDGRFELLFERDGDNRKQKAATINPAKCLIGVLQRLPTTTALMKEMQCYLKANVPREMWESPY